MKKEYTLSQQFALISLDGLSCNHRSAAKYAALRGIAAAKLLEEILLGREDMPAVQEFQTELEASIAAIKNRKKKEMDAVERETADLLLADGGIEIVPDLLGCDMNYYTAGISMKSYRSDREVYLSIVESVRAEILEEGPITMECACLLWLIRESGCIHDICSVKEQEKIQVRMTALCGEEELTDADYIGMIWRQEFHRSGEHMIKSFLKGKRELFKNPYLEGVNLLFPFLDRRQAIFVDFVIFGTTVKDRRWAMMEFLSERGHFVEETKNGSETLLRIDNAYYRVWPKTVRSYKIPIQGASLLPVYW
ncbi:hypothetical protein D7X98_11655 [bacterium 1XD8-76]|nr:hypothetical protein D7X98_11655 [bacterium 1XD8-76]